MEPGFAREPREDGEGFIQLRMPSISDEGFIDLTVTKRVDASPEEVEKYRVHRGDVILNNTNSPEIVGNAAVFDRAEECLFSNHMTRLRIKPALADPGFVALVLHGYWKAGYSRTQAKHWVNQAAIDQPALARFLVPLPPLSEQRRVVEILREAESVRRLRATADRLTSQLIPAIFHEMFGDPPAWIDPVNLGTAVRIVGGGTPSRAETRYFRGDIPWATSKDIKRWYLDDAREHINQEAIDNSATNLVPTGTILLVVKSKILMHSLPMGIITRSFCFGQDLKGLVPQGDFTPEFIIAALSVQKDDILRKARGVNTEGLTIEILHRLRLPRATRERMREFQRRAWAIRDVVSGSEKASDVFDAVLASLLSHAFTGELTARWRERHAGQLATEARQRDEALRAVGTPLARPPSVPEAEPEATDDGRMSELTAEQCKLWNEIPDRPFTAVSLASAISGPLHHRADVIRRHLEVFCARGLLLSVKRRRQDSTQRVELAQLYRKPTAAEEGWLEEKMALLAQSFGRNKA
jgi:type I restriction enzyme S subunit